MADAIALSLLCDFTALKNVPLTRYSCQGTFFILQEICGELVRFWQSGRCPPPPAGGPVPDSRFPERAARHTLRHRAGPHLLRCRRAHTAYGGGVCAQVEAVAVGHDHAVNILLFTQQIQIAVDRSPADMGVRSRTL